MSKSKGLCPFCNTVMDPLVVESNFMRRDKCRCTECTKIIYVCRTPLCNDFAKGGDHYDDEFCEKHTKALIGFVKDIPNKIKAEQEKQQNKNKT